MRELILVVGLAAAAVGCSEAGAGGPGGSGGTAPPPANVDQTCRDWCANEPEGLSCHQGAAGSVQGCYEDCLRDYQSEAERQCGDEWIAIKDCQVDLECEDLFGDCEPAEAAYDQCVATGGTGGTGGMGGIGGMGGGVSPVAVDAEWNLTCPAGSAVDCGALVPNTCLGVVGQRSIVGEHGQLACTGDPIVAVCEVVERIDGMRTVTLEANVGDKFAFELRGATIDADGSVEQTACNVTIIEDQVSYDIGACGQDAPSMEQPCELSDVSVEGNEVSFGLECRSLISSTTAAGFNVGAVGGGPTTIRFDNCLGGAGGTGGAGGDSPPTITMLAWQASPVCLQSEQSEVVVTVTATDPDTDVAALTYRGSVSGCTGAIDAAVSTVGCPNVAPYPGTVMVSDPDGNDSTPVSFRIGVCESGSCTTAPDTCTE
jgi:hypothetical protein